MNLVSLYVFFSSFSFFVFGTTKDEFYFNDWPEMYHRFIYIYIYLLRQISLKE